MAKICTSIKLIKNKINSLKRNLHSIDAIGHLMILKEPESQTNKYFKILVNKYLIICTMDIMQQFLRMVKLGQVNHARWKVFRIYNQKGYFNYAYKMYFVENKKQKAKELQQLSELHICKSTMKN